MTVFDVFECRPYTFLKIGRGTIYGNKVIDEVEAFGVLKMKDGLTITARESDNSQPRLHVKPSESFASDEMVGNGVRIDGVEFSIVGVTTGRNFDTGEVEHYSLTLQKANFVE